MCTRGRNKKFCNSSIDAGISIEYATRANTRIVVLAHANSQMQVRRLAVASAGDGGDSVGCGGGGDGSGDGSGDSGAMYLN